MNAPEDPYFTDVEINGRWRMRLPDFRALRYLQVGALGHERERMASMRVNLDANDVLLDVGAESGDMSALFATWVRYVVLVEPNQVAWSNIRATFEANGLPAPAASWVGFASDVTTGGDAYAVDWPACTDGPLVAAHGFRELTEETDIPHTTIDDLVDRPATPTPTAVTIDVEGAELRVLAGARRFLATHRPLVWVSIHPTLLRQHYRSTPADVYAFLESSGYRVTHLGDDHETHILAEPR